MLARAVWNTSVCLFACMVAAAVTFPACHWSDPLQDQYLRGWANGTSATFASLQQAQEHCLALGSLCGGVTRTNKTKPRQGEYSPRAAMVAAHQPGATSWLKLCGKPPVPPGPTPPTPPPPPTPAPWPPAPAPPSTPTYPAAGSRPHIVVHMTDDMGYYDTQVSVPSQLLDYCAVKHACTTAATI